MNETCEAGMFRRCSAAVTRKCRCCDLWLCAVHYHALTVKEPRTHIALDLPNGRVLMQSTEAMANDPQ
jgi:hypothetical protein